MQLEIIDILHLVLIMFSSIIGTILILILLRIMRILGPITELIDFYNKIKQVVLLYKHIPELVKEKVQEIIKKD